MTRKARHSLRARLCSVGAVAVVLAGCGSSGMTVAAAAARSRGTATVPGAGHGATTGAPASAYPLGVTVYPSARRRALPSVAGRTLDGRELTLSSLRDHVVVLNVWASWCIPCRTESPALAALSRSSAGSQVRFVGIDENDVPADATAFLRAVGATYPDLVDNGTVLRRLSGWLPPALPGSLVLDRQGRVAIRIVGPVRTAQLQPLLSQVAGA